RSLRKYTGTYFFPLSISNTVLMLSSDVARVSLNPLLCNEMPKERSFFNTERAFAWVELHINCSKLVEGFFDVNEHVFFRVAFYDHVIDANFKVASYLIAKHLID
ncbi:hypothetical protein Tco_0135614, partial [Tanacetum coccineum]